MYKLWHDELKNSWPTKNSSMVQRTNCVGFCSYFCLIWSKRLWTEIDLFLKNFLAANPAKSMYGFTLNRKRPGHFNLCFLANKNSIVQTWVRMNRHISFSYELIQPDCIANTRCARGLLPVRGSGCWCTRAL